VKIPSKGWLLSASTNLGIEFLHGSAQSATIGGYRILHGVLQNSRMRDIPANPHRACAIEADDYDVSFIGPRLCGGVIRSTVNGRSRKSMSTRFRLKKRGRGGRGRGRERLIAARSVAARFFRWKELHSRMRRDCRSSYCADVREPISRGRTRGAGMPTAMIFDAMK